jgi:hypothetical protein
MKRYLALATATLFITFSVGKADDIDTKIKEIQKSAYEEGYKKGYLDAQLKEKEKWKEEGRKEIIDRLMMYSNLIDRIFNYKILLQKGNMLPPQVALICDIPSNEYSQSVNCRYEIVAPARFVDPKDMNFKSLIADGKIEELTRPEEPGESVANLITNVYYIGDFDYEVGLDVLKKIYNMGLKTIQKNINGRLLIAVVGDSAPADKIRMLSSAFNVRKMTLDQFMSYTPTPKQPVVMQQPQPQQPVQQSFPPFSHPQQPIMQPPMQPSQAQQPQTQPPTQPPMPIQPPTNQPMQTVQKSGYLCTTTRLKLRTKPNEDSRVIKILKKGTKVKVVETDADWVKISRPALGWVYGEYLEECHSKK